MRADVIKIALKNVKVDASLYLRQPVYGEDLSDIITDASFFYQPVETPLPAQWIADALTLYQQNRRVSYVMEYNGGQVGWFTIDINENANRIDFNWGIDQGGFPSRISYVESSIAWLVPQLQNLGAQIYLVRNPVNNLAIVPIIRTQLGFQYAAGLDQTKYYYQQSANILQNTYSLSYNKSTKSCGCK